MRDWLVIFHILGAALWIGGGLFSWYAFNQLANAGSTAGNSVQTLASRADRFFGPAAGLTLLTGIALVLLVDPWTWSDVFVWIGIGVFAFSAAWQPLVGSRAETRLLDTLESGGDVRPALGLFNRAAAVEVGVVLIALWAMVMKVGA